MYVATAVLGRAARDYRWLLDGGYPETASLKLVGDRHRLDRDERLVLFRGVADSAASEKRGARLCKSAAGRTLLIDGYNEVYTVMHYLAGRPVFIASDALVRDAGAAHGRISDRALFNRAVSIFVASLALLGLKEVFAWFDAPVPHSAEHARNFQAALLAEGINGWALVARSADGPLKKAEAGTAVATSDSAIVDSLADTIFVFDAARAAIEATFGPREWLDFRDLLGRATAPSLLD